MTTDPTTHQDVEALADVIHQTRRSIPGGWTHEIAAAVLASDWFAARVAAARAEAWDEGEQAGWRACFEHDEATNPYRAVVSREPGEGDTA